MLSKIKKWIFGKVILGKVVGKFAKHGAGAIVGLLSSPVVAPWVANLGITVDETQLTAGLVVVMTGLYGAVYNFVEHRFKK